MAADHTGTVLHLAQATRRYGNQPALDRVDLELAAGEVYALVGRNGAGKSTLAKAAIGALALDSGTVRVLGADPGRDRNIRREIGIAPQEIALYPHLTIVENLDAFATLAGLTRGERSAAIAWVLYETACAERADERLYRLSGGWRRRANLAAAIVHQPRLLVLDEPTEGLDSETRIILHRLIDGLRADGTAILLISHNAEDILTLADRLGVMDAGRLIAEGPPDALMAAAFGGRTELTLRLSAPTPSVEPILAARSLTSPDGGLYWSGMVLDPLTQAREIEVALHAAGIKLHELTVKPPGLDALITWAAAAAARHSAA